MYHRVRKKMFLIIILLTHPASSSSRSITTTDTNIDNQIIDFDQEYSVKFNKIYNQEIWNTNEFKNSHKYTIINGNHNKINKENNINLNNNTKLNNDQKDINDPTTTDYRVIPLELLSTTIDPIISMIESTMEPDLTVIPLTTTQKLNIDIDYTVTLPTTEQDRVTTNDIEVTTDASYDTDKLEDLNNSTHVFNNTKLLIESDSVIKRNPPEKEKGDYIPTVNNTSTRADKFYNSSINYSISFNNTENNSIVKLNTTENFNNTTVNNKTEANNTRVDDFSNNSNINTDSFNYTEKDSIIKVNTTEDLDNVTTVNNKTELNTQVNNFSDSSINNNTYSSNNTNNVITVNRIENVDNITTVNNKTEANDSFNNTKKDSIIKDNSDNITTVNNKTEANETIKEPISELDSNEELMPIFTELDSVEREKVPEDYYDSKDIIPTPAPKTDALSVLFGFAGSVVESVVETVAEKVVPKTIFDLFKRMQKQNEALEAERLRSREENGGLGQFGRGILKSISTGLKPLSQLMTTAKEGGSLDTDRGFISSFAPVVSGVTNVANVANSLVDAFKDKVQAIYPGTVWCGDGHSATARSSSELGLFFFTDTCCRQHDACKIYIKAGETMYGLTNTGLFTRSHCSCDASFRECLRRTNSLVSAQIGLTYFNVLSPQCFRRAHPIVKCLKRTRITGQKCEEYELDYTKPKMWQWFDNESF